MNVAVIGAGSAGLPVAQALKARGLDFTVFEAGSGVGGNWRYDNDSRLSSGYASLRTNTSRLQTGYRSYRMPRRGPLFLHHTEMLAYLEAYTDHFGLREHIRFKTLVTEARPDGDGGWLVNGEPFDALVVATGYNSRPVVPRLPGSFDGLQMHTHAYRTPEPFAGKDVVVVGMGCSATELAVEVARVAARVTLAVRSGNWVVRRRIGPFPMDWFDSRASSRLPWSMRRRFIRAVVRATHGRQERIGLPLPPGRILDKPAAVSDGLIRAVRAGRIAVAPNVTELLGDRVRFADGTERAAGAILWGTGYETALDFLPPEAEAPTIERAPLYRGVTSLALPNLHFVGIIGGHGALIAMFESQAEWVAEVLAGRLQLPSPEVMRASVERAREQRARDFDPRYDFLYDRLRYCRALESEVAAAG